MDAPTNMSEHGIEPRIDWDRIERFIGYGFAEAPVVFLGMEEGGDNDRLPEDLIGRSLSDQFEEIGHRKTTQRTWRVMCDLMLRREGVKNPTGQERLAYQQDRLGKRGGDTLVAELMPYPSRRASDWPKIYEQRFATRPDYLSSLAPKRRDMLRDLLRSTPRELIICYGKAHWDHYRAIFDHPSIPGPASHIEIGEWESARVVLAPHFCSRAFNSEAQLASFAQVALA
jgi:hypothetical protein